MVLAQHSGIMLAVRIELGQRPSKISGVEFKRKLAQRSSLPWCGPTSSVETKACGKDGMASGCGKEIFETTPH